MNIFMVRFNEFFSFYSEKIPLTSFLYGGTIFSVVKFAGISSSVDEGKTKTDREE